MGPMSRGTRLDTNAVTGLVSKFLQTMIRKTFFPAPSPSTRRGTASLDATPAELIHEILLRLPPSCILNFGLTNRKNYELSLPALYHRVILTLNTMPRFYETNIDCHSPSLRWVRELQLGSPDLTIGDAALWDVLGDSSIITTFPNLRVLDALHHAPMRGWTGLLHVLETLPPATLELQGSISWRDDLKLWPTDRVFSSYRKLVLSFTWEPLSEFFPVQNDVAQTLSGNFPNLISLSLMLPHATENLAAFLRGCHFPALGSFHLTLVHSTWESQKLDFDASSALDVFFNHHTSTLRELHTPCWTVAEEAIRLFRSSGLKLHHLCACYHMLATLGQSPNLPSSLRTLHLLNCSHELTSHELPPLRALTTVHTWDVGGVIVRPFAGFDGFAGKLPNLHTLRIHLDDKDITQSYILHLEASKQLFRLCAYLQKVVFLSPGREQGTLYSIVRGARGSIKLRRV
ncbi:hypothetical protein C8Q79DRAFT_262316 [Trametes meyenii]|nr:hypothetical protein C8Q79DRAFT_262316 [Trametes meyenii]